MGLSWPFAFFYEVYSVIYHKVPIFLVMIRRGVKLGLVLKFVLTDITLLFRSLFLLGNYSGVGREVWAEIVVNKLVDRL